MRDFIRRTGGIALLVLFPDELVKTVSRLLLNPCSTMRWAQCDSLNLVGPLSLVHTSNAGSALGFGQGWWIWAFLALCGVLLIPFYAGWLRGGGWVTALAVGLQVGGALGNALDRLTLGGASDVLYMGVGPTWNLADLAIGAGALLATWALARRQRLPTAALHDDCELTLLPAWDRRRRESARGSHRGVVVEIPMRRGHDPGVKGVSNVPCTIARSRA
jgi:signal peptidase II